MNFLLRKITLLVLLSVLLSNLVYCQEYRKLRLTVGIGLAPLTFIEPSFRINDQFFVGVKWESIPSWLLYVDRSSLAITSQCYLTKDESIRPFIGLGLGYYHFGEFLSGSSSICDQIYNKSKVGFFPRIGFDTRRLTVALDFNLIGSISYLQRCNFKASTEISETRNYLTLKAGLTIGGGKKEPEAGNLLDQIKKFFKRI